MIGSCVVVVVVVTLSSFSLSLFVSSLMSMSRQMVRKNTRRISDRLVGNRRNVS